MKPAMLQSAAPTEMGAGIAASPHLHRAKDLPVFASLVAFAPRSSILAHQLRRRFRSWSSPKAGSRPSAALLGLVPFASLAPRGSRELRLEDQLFRRLFRWSDLGRSPPHRHPVEIGPSVTCRFFLPLPALRRGGDFRPDHPCNLTHFSESRKRKKRVFACG